MDVIVSVTAIVKEIADCAKKNKMDVIVVGCRGMCGFDGTDNARSLILEPVLDEQIGIG